MSKRPRIDTFFSEHHQPQTFSCPTTTQENAMAPTDSTDRITFWQDHVTAWQVSDLTQKAASIRSPGPEPERCPALP